MIKQGYLKSFLCRNEKNYDLRILQSPEEFKNNHLLIEMFNRLATEAEIDLDKKLRQKGERLKYLHKPEELWQVSEEWIESSFNKGNRYVFVVEEKGYPICAMIALVNDKETMEKMKAPEGSFVYITHAITQEDEKGKGWLGLLLNKAMTMFSNPKRELPLPLTYSISVSTAAALTKEGEVNYVLNLPLYAQMWEKRFDANKLQIRFQDINDRNKQEGREKLDLKQFLIDGTLNEPLVSKLIEEKKPEAETEGKFVRGLFLEGVSKPYEEAKSFRQMVQERATTIVRSRL